MKDLTLTVTLTLTLTRRASAFEAVEIQVRLLYGWG